MVSAIVFCAILCLSCEKEPQTIVEGNSAKTECIQNQLYFGEYSKELIVYDEAHKNSAIVKFGTEDLEYFNSITSDNFILIPVSKGETIQKAVQTFLEKYPVANDELDEDDAMNVPDDMNIIHTYRQILSKDLDANTENVILVDNPKISSASESKAKPWLYDISYGVAPVVGDHIGIQEAVFTGHNTSYPGYYALDYTMLSTGETSTIVPEYAIIRTGKTKSFLRQDCRVMIAKRKYKGTNQSVQVTFTY